VIAVTDGHLEAARPFRIGVLPASAEGSGGVFQYSQVMLSVLADLRRQRTDEFVVFGNSLGPRSPVLSGVSWEIHPISPPTRGSRIARYLDQHALRRLSVRRRDLVHSAYHHLRRFASPPPSADPSRRPDVHTWLVQCEIDLMLYPTPVPLAFEAAIPYVMAIHDLQHRLHPEFPEVSADGEYARREYVFRNGVREAAMILTDSDVGKEDVLEFYGDLIEPERIAVLPFLPATPERALDDDRARVRRTYQLPDRYLFYPAQFWPHKNHLRLIESLALLRDSDGFTPDLVLVGSATGKLRGEHFSRVMARADELGIRRAVHHFGYVPAEDMAALYTDATSLIMPTFFGPTNIPILEAWALDCPVITSDIRGVRDQAGDAALLADPGSTEQLMDAIRRVWVDDTLRHDLIRRGRQRLKLNSREEFTRRLAAVLDTATSLTQARSAH
jgi:glycosyltransferase involved in cell wall biosynthesis